MHDYKVQGTMYDSMNVKNPTHRVETDSGNGNGNGNGNGGNGNGNGKGGSGKGGNGAVRNHPSYADTELGEGSYSQTYSPYNQESPSIRLNVSNEYRPRAKTITGK